MKTLLKLKFVAALRSRRYRQGRGHLRSRGDYPGDADRYCALGVLLDVAGCRWYADSPECYSADLGVGVRTAYHLPRAVRDRLELSDDQADAIVALNDACGWSFAEIADAVRDRF